MSRSRRQLARPGVECLEGRELLSVVGFDRSQGARAAAWVDRVAARSVTPAQRSVLPEARARFPLLQPTQEKTDEPFVLKRDRVTIYGLLMPAPWVTDGKYRGAALVSGGVVWLLDLTAVKGFDSYAQAILGQAIAAFGSAEIEQNAQGEQTRKLKVGWMEPLQDPSQLPPAFPALQPILHPNFPRRD